VRRRVVTIVGYLSSSVLSVSWILCSTVFAAPKSATQERVGYLEPLILSDRILASASTLSGAPRNKIESDFLRYAIEVRRSYGYGRAPSAALLQLRDSLGRNPGAIFDFLMRWEKEAQDCTGTATASLFATFAELAPSYAALRSWLDIRLTDIARSQNAKQAFRFVRCSEDPEAINQHDADLLTAIFLGIRYQLEATGQGASFKVPSEQVLAKISQPGLKSAVARLKDKVARTTPDTK
jgi:hypothetical protein